MPPSPLVRSWTDDRPALLVEPPGGLPGEGWCGVTALLLACGDDLPVGAAVAIIGIVFAFFAILVICVAVISR